MGKGNTAKFSFASAFMLCLLAGMASAQTANPSFVSVQSGQLYLNSQPFYFSGTNAYYLNTYEKINPSYVTQSLDLFAQNNITVVRMWGFQDGTECGYWAGDPVLQVTPGVYNETALRLMDSVVKKAKDRNLKLIISFVNFWGDLGGICQYNKWAGYNGSQNPTHDEAIFFHANANTKQWYKNYASAILNRVNTQTGVAYKDEPAIMAWELANEDEIPSESDPTILRNWYQEMAQHIKSIDSTHLVTTGEQGFEQGMDYAGSPYSRNLSNTYVLRAGEGTSFMLNVQIPEIDFAQIHIYPDAFGFSTANNYTAWIVDSITYTNDHARIAQQFGKPTIIGEYGSGYYTGWDADSAFKQRAYPAWWSNSEQNANVSGDLLWQFAIGAKCTESGGNICATRDPILTQLLNQHSYRMRTKSSSPPPADTAEPTVSITSPANNSAVNGTIAITASASDNVAVAGVQFRLDGANLGSEDTSSPYSVSWNTATATNGIHNLTATARDAAGNSKASAAIRVNVNNAAPGTLLVVDRTNVDTFSQIPDAAISAAAAYRSMLQHASVGKNISDGLNALQAQNSKYSRVNMTFVNIGNPTWDAKVSTFASYVAANQGQFSAMAMKFCFINEEAVFATYRDAMESLAASYPAKKFVWWTMPITTGDGASSLRSAFNSNVRAYVQSNNKILYDLADIESHRPDGTACTYNGYEALCSEYSVDGGHQNALGNQRAAQAYWYLVARLAGWDGSTGAGDTTTPTVSITSPANNSNVNSTITITASASDNVAVAGVQFRLDGANLGAEDTSSPYSYSWNTATATNGIHNLTAVARDAAGNSRASAVVRANVNNAVAPAPTISVSYQQSSENFLNPERGFFGDIIFGDATCDPGRGGRMTPATVSELNNIKNAYNVSLIFLGFESMCTAVSRNFTQSELDLFSNSFSAVRGAGMKAVFRFSYTQTPLNPEASLPQMLAHMEQLRPIFQQNKDVIAFVQTGFIGAWGEWHDSPNPVFGIGINWTNRDNYRQVLFKLLDVVPVERNVQLRTPYQKELIFNTTDTIPQSMAFTGEPRARTGHHNDCLFSSSIDGGTYSPSAGGTNPYPWGRSIDQWKSYLASENQYVAQGGESCGTYNQYSACLAAIPSMAQMRWTYLNRGFSPSVLNGWIADGCMPEIYQRLGYRLSLSNAAFQSTVAPGATMRVQLNITNTGFASPVNGRMAQLIMRATDGTRYYARLPVDPRTWLGGTTTPIDLNIGVPASVPSGNYELLMHLPDPEPSIYSRPEYAIRLANLNTWEISTGYNRLLANVTVSPTGQTSGAAAVSFRDTPDTTPITYSYVADTTAPSVSVSHSPASPTSSQNVTYTATASDASGISQIQIYVDGALARTCSSATSCSITAGPYGASTSHTYYATAADNSPNANTGRHPSTGTRNFTVAAALLSGEMEVYSENALNPPWTFSQSYGGTNNPANTNPVYSGATSINATYRGWGDLNLRYGDYWTTLTINPAQYSSLDFAAHGGASGVVLRVALGVRDSNGGSARFAQYRQISVPANSWSVYSFPMGELNSNSTLFNDIGFNVYQGANATFYLDNIKLAGSGGSPSNDTTTPNVSITSPANNSAVNGTITITATASDNVAVAGVQFRLDGSNLGAEDTISPYSISWNTATATNGLHNLTATARDSAGNSRASATVRVTVSNAPTSAITIMPLGDSITEYNWQGGYRAQLYKLLVDNGVNFDFVGVKNNNHDQNNLGFEFPQAYWDHEGYNSATITRAAGTTWIWNENVASQLAANPPKTVLVLLGTNDLVQRTGATVRNDMSAFLDQIWAFDPNINVVLGAPPPSRVADHNSRVNDYVALLPALVSEKAALGRKIVLANHNAALTTADLEDNYHPSPAGFVKMAQVWYTALMQLPANVSDVIAPNVSITSPANNSVVNGTISITASASDNVAVAGVQFLLDGAALGAEDTVTPYSYSWNTSTAANGWHNISATARDSAGNSRTVAIRANVSNAAVVPPPVAYSWPSTPMRGIGIGSWGFSSSQLTEEDFIKLKGWNVNIVRLHAKGIPAAGDLERVLDLAEKYDIKVVIALMCLADTNTCTSSPTTYRPWNYPYNVSFWSDFSAQDGVFAFWDNVTRRAKGRGDVVAGYDLLNEPAPLSYNDDKFDIVTIPGSPNDLGYLYSRLIQSIRAIDPSHTIIIESRCNGQLCWKRANTASPYQYTVSMPIVDESNIVYSFHWYNPLEYTHQGVGTNPLNDSYPGNETNRGYFDATRTRNEIMKIRDFAQANNAKIFMGEYSVASWAANGSNWLYDVTSAFDEFGFSSTYHHYDEYSGWNLEVGSPDRLNVMKSYWAQAGAPPDTTAPSVTVSHSPLSPNSTQNVTFTANASDASGIRQLQISVDGGIVRTCSYATSCSYIGGPYTAGSAHTYYAAATDNSTNLNIGRNPLSGTRNFTAQPASNTTDTIAPNVSITSPANGSSLWGALAVAASASDNVGVAGVQFRLDGSNLGAEDTAAPYSVSWNTSFASNGWHNLSATARDAAGNRRNASAIRVNVANSVANNTTIDTTRPTVNVLHSPAQPTVSDSVAITATAADASGIRQIRIFLDGSLSIACGVSPCSTFAAKFQQGVHTYYAIATDASSSNNSQASATYNFTVTPAGSGSGSIGADGGSSGGGASGGSSGGSGGGKGKGAAYFYSYSKSIKFSGADINLTRTIEIGENNITYVTLKITNGLYRQMKNFRVRDRISQKFSTDASEISFSIQPEHFETGSIIAVWRFGLLDSGESLSLTYSVPRYVPVKDEDFEASIEEEPSAPIRLLGLKATLFAPEKVTMGQEITLYVADENSNPVPGAMVTVTNPENKQANYLTDAKGEVKFTPALEGSYQYSTAGVGDARPTSVSAKPNTAPAAAPATPAQQPEEFPWTTLTLLGAIMVVGGAALYVLTQKMKKPPQPENIPGAGNEPLEYAPKDGAPDYGPKTESP